ncbi:MAG: sigma-70 family RNA polymerase sigma factor [Prevotellaceae bacterium]|jgi:RNA polymerase sigma-70 factor (ECF subfamily)|nr:sigma-70 family RNA polymerase sigma factor [Prevotellaceae bacterium]
MPKETDKVGLQQIEKARRGDVNAFNVLVDRYYEGVLLRLKQRLGNVADAEDIAQQTFAKAFENINSYSDKYAFSTWIYSIANNCCIDFMRKRRMGSTISIDKLVEDEDFNTQNAQLNPEENMIAEQNMVEASLLLSKLKLKLQYRRIIELRYLKEYAYEEIAAELNIPIGTVKTHLFRAKEMLVKMIVKAQAAES